MRLTRTLALRAPLQAALVAAALLALVVLLLMPSRGSAQTAQTVQIGPLALTPAEEVPPVTVNAVGLFSATVTSNSLTFDLSADGDQFTMAHIHIGAKGTNGPIVAFLYGPADPLPAIHPTGTITAANLIGPIAGDWAAFAAALAAGNLYVNAHSVDHPGGSVRVQIPATTPPTPPATVTATPAPPATGAGTADDGSLSGAALGGILLIVVATSVGAVHLSRRRS